MHIILHLPFEDGSWCIYPNKELSTVFNQLWIARCCVYIQGA